MEYTNSQIRELIDEYVHSKRDREILYERLINGMCYEMIAESFQMSTRQIKTIVYKNEERLFSHIPKDAR